MRKRKTYRRSSAPKSSYKGVVLVGGLALGAYLVYYMYSKQKGEESSGGGGSTVPTPSPLEALNQSSDKMMTLAQKGKEFLQKLHILKTPKPKPVVIPRPTDSMAAGTTVPAAYGMIKMPQAGVMSR